MKTEIELHKMSSLLLSRCAVASPRCLQARFQQTLTSAYIFHPNVQTTEADKQMFWLTKSVKVERPPTAFSELMEQVDIEPMRRIMEATILVSRLYEMREIRRKSKKNPKDLTHGTHANFPSSLLQNKFKNVMGFGKVYPQLFNLNPAVEAPVSATWKIQDETLSVHGRPGTYLNSKQSMPMFYRPEDVEASRTVPVPSLQSPISPFTDLNKYLVKDTACTGLHAEKAFYPHFHTLLVVDNGDYIPPPTRGIPEIQLIQKALLFTFSRLLAQAVAKHGSEVMGQVLPEPECGQSIMTNGSNFMFLWYQLNTLDMRELDSGVKNMVCIQRPGQAFTTIETKLKKKPRLDGFKEDILKMYLSMLLM